MSLRKVRQAFNFLLVLGLVLGVSACGFDFGMGTIGDAVTAGGQGSELNNGPLPPGCGKIEGGSLGEAVDIQTGSAVVSIYEWVEKDDSPGEYIGFRYTVSGGDVFVSVKAGGEILVAPGDGEWMHPNGTSGPEVSGISNVVCCDDTGDVPCDPALDDTCRP